MTHTRKGVVVALLATALTIGMVDAVPAWAAAPTITSFTPTSGKLGTTVTVTGTGFTAPATVKFNGVAATVNTVSSSTTIVTRVPYTAASGPLTVTTAGGTATSTASFTVTPGVLLTKTVGPPTTALSALFSGFAPGEAVDVYVDTTDVALVPAGSTGAATVPVTIPANAVPGTHYVTAVGRKSGVSAQASFLVRTDWAQYGFGSGRTNTNPYEGTLGAADVATLTRAWSTPAAVLANYAGQQATVAGGVVYLGNAAGLSAFSETTGAKVWSQAVNGGVYSAPAVSGGLVLIGTSSGHLMAFTASTGAPKYDFAFSGESIDRPIVVSGSRGFVEVDQGSTSATIIGFDVGSGATDWQQYYNSTSCFGLSVAAATLYTTCNDGHLRALQTSNGALVFDEPGTTDLAESTPIVANGLVYSAGFDRNTGTNAVFAFDSDTGDLAWVTDTTVDTSSSSPLVADRGTVFLAADVTSGGANEVVAFSEATGQVVWTQTVPVVEFYTPAAANGLLYVTGRSTSVLDETTGAVVTQVRGSVFTVVTDAGLITATVTGSALLRYALPGPATASVERPTPVQLRPDRSLRLTPSTS